jgi:hypothetical protein
MSYIDPVEKYGSAPLVEELQGSLWATCLNAFLVGTHGLFCFAEIVAFWDTLSSSPSRFPPAETRRGHPATGRPLL